MPGKRKRPSFYAVVRGREPGIYYTWKECERQVSGFSSALFKSFSTISQAESYITQNTNTIKPIESIPNPTKRKKIQKEELLPYFIDKAGDPQLRAQLKQQYSKNLYTTMKKVHTIPKAAETQIDRNTSNTNQIIRSPTQKCIDLTSDTSEEITEEEEEEENQPEPEQIKEETSKVSTGDEFISLDVEPSKITYENLGDDQKRVYDAVVTRKESIFFTGSAGTGKSFLLRVIVRALNSSGLFITASTGISSIQIGGQTLHSFAGIELGEGDFSSLLEKAYRLKKKWCECSTLIIDEISMISGKLFDQLEHIARVIRENEKPFGGIQLVICGDFFQLPPVNRKEKFAFQATSWDQCIKTTIELVQVYRQNESKFISCLNEIRHGICTIKTNNFLSRNNKILNVEDGVLPTRLYCTNRAVDGENNKELARIENREIVFASLDRDPLSIPKEHRKKIWPILKRSLSSALMSEEITVKIGAQVMLLRNKSDYKLVNGSRGVVIDTLDITKENWPSLKKTWIEAENPKVDANSVDMWYKRQLELALINPGAYTYNDKGNLIIQLPVVRFANGTTLRPVLPVSSGTVIGKEEYWYRIQVPLKLSWAMTIHKSQGMTLDRCQLNLSRVFEAGQAYVALSRLQSLEGLELHGFSQNCVFADRAVLEFYAWKCNDPIAIQYLAQQDMLLLKQ